MIFLLLVLLLIPSTAFAASCTPGTDCYADCVNGPSTIGTCPTCYKNAACQTKFGVGVPVDANVLMVEDFEPNQYHDDVGLHGGTPFYGPWYDSWNGSADTCDRGFNSLWRHRYSN